MTDDTRQRVQRHLTQLDNLDAARRLFADLNYRTVRDTLPRHDWPQRADEALADDPQVLAVHDDFHVIYGRLVGEGPRQLTAEHNIRRQPEHLDFSTSVVSYAKAVETVPFRDESGCGPDDVRNSFLRQFMAGQREHLTLGSFQRILPSRKETALRAFALRVFPVGEARLFGKEGVAGLLNDDEMIALRNKAAHDEVLTREEARKARVWAMEILGNL